MKKLLRERSALVYVLIALIPYSKPNLLLAYKPGLFFKELEKISRYKQTTLKAAYWRAQRDGLIDARSNLPMITAKGHRKITPFVAERLKNHARLMVIFDIPENQKTKRQKFRQILKQWQFRKVQKSVWLTGKDYREELIDVVKELRLHDYVELYECAKHFPK